jgi:hypothetical protein
MLLQIFNTGRSKKSSPFLITILGFIAGLAFLCPPGEAGARPKKLPFYPGERLTFQVKWAFIPAAEGVLEVMPPAEINGVKSFHFSMTARTYEVVDIFFKVRDRLDSYVDEGMGQSLLFRQRQEGKEKRDVLVTFDWDEKEAQYSNFDEKNEPIPILPGAFDPLSVFYAFRLVPLREGGEIQVPVTDGKKCVIGKARVIRREKIKVRDIEYDTFLVEPSLEHIGGVFEHGKSSKALIWVTADEACIPVRVKSEVIVGSFVAELVSVQGRPPSSTGSFPPQTSQLSSPSGPGIREEGD